MKIREYFPDSELECKCGCGMLPAMEYVEKLYIFRMLLGVPFVPTSVARCKAHNRHVGGRKDSFHIQLIDRAGVGAGDIPIVADMAKMYDCAVKAGFTGVGINTPKGFMHTDNRKQNHLTFWIY